MVLCDSCLRTRVSTCPRDTTRCRNCKEPAFAPALAGRWSGSFMVMAASVRHLSDFKSERLSPAPSGASLRASTFYARVLIASDPTALASGAEKLQKACSEKARAERATPYPVAK